MNSKKSGIILNNDGSLDMVLSNQVELTDKEKQELGALERILGQLSNAETLIKSETAQIEIALMNVPDYNKLMKLKAKVKVVREMLRKNKIMLDAKYEQLFSERGLKQRADLYLDKIPDPKPKGKRGRPKSR
jgi:hypothetical protein